MHRRKATGKIRNNSQLQILPMIRIIYNNQIQDIISFKNLLFLKPLHFNLFCPFPLIFKIGSENAFQLVDFVVLV